MTEWYSPGKIRFQRDEMIWMTENLPLLEEGIWPREPSESGYTETANVQKSRSHKAPFETAAQYFAEVTARMFPKDENGKIIQPALHAACNVLVWEVQHGLNDYELLSPTAKTALNYISGWDRRKMSYSKWKRQRRYRGGQTIK